MGMERDGEGWEIVDGEWMDGDGVGVGDWEVTGRDWDGEWMGWGVCVDGVYGWGWGEDVCGMVRGMGSGWGWGVCGGGWW